MQTLKSQLFVDKFTESVQHTFLDYLAGGCELNFMVAVDFTGAYQNLFILLYHLFVFFFLESYRCVFMVQ